MHGISLGNSRCRQSARLDGVHIVDSLLSTTFIMGLLGGVHCIGMCGGVAGALAMRGQRSRLADLIACNVGRIASYAIGGALVAAIGQASFLYQGMLPVQTIFLTLANFLLVLTGAYLAGWSRAVLVLERAGARAWSLIRTSVWKKAHVSSSPFFLGAAWGWIPCGLVYSAFALALMAGNPTRGALAMTAFGVGTMPSLLAAGFAANAVRRRFQSRFVRVLAGSVVIGFGLVGLYRIPQLGEIIRAGLMCLT